MTQFSPDKHPRDSEGKFTGGARTRGTQRKLTIQKIARALLPKEDKRQIAEHDRRQRTGSDWGRFGSEDAYDRAVAANPNDPYIKRLQERWRRA
jgi:hypothetical protein